MIDNVSRMELLRMAREMVVNEHIDRRAEIHNRWANESEELWRTKRLRLAYPSIPPYPTEKDIVERAQALLDFISDRETTKPEKEIKEINEVTEATQEVKQDIPESATEDNKDSTHTTTTDPVSEKTETETPKPMEIDPMEYAKIKVARDLDLNSTAAGRVLPISLKKFFRSNE